MKPVTGFTAIASENSTPPPDSDSLIWIKKDANSNHGGKYVFIGKYYEQDKPPVVKVDFLIQDEPEPHTPAHWKSNNTDLNAETKGHLPPPIEGWIAVNRDLAAGAGGSYIFAYYLKKDS
ncbi:hypothetical protein C1645_816210 [Glomus cerebriforme]|uniref:MABP domain-containing protein n=1 Tax=Glomus cerebriforme TaxID=658196 RepID=A0A397TLP7_9GLOM|nr:hypothetical protein C1645_816210 [Glomus cerebriforme]